MPKVSTTRGYKGRGEFVLRPLSGGRPFTLGNVTTINESIEVDRTSRPSFKDASGGELDVEEIVSSYTFEATVDDLSPENIALAFLGTSTEMESLAITDEEVNVWAGVQQALKYIPDTDVALTVEIDASDAHATDTAYAVGDTILEGGRAYLAVVAGTSDSTPPTFVTDLSTFTDGTVTWKDLGDPALTEGTHFETTPHGLRVLASEADRFHEELPIPLLVDYTRNPQYVIQALVNSGQEFAIDWHGLNSIDSGNPIIGRYFRIKFSPTSGFSRHGGDDFASLTLSGTVLADENQVGQGISKFVETLMI